MMVGISLISQKRSHEELLPKVRGLKILKELKRLSEDVYKFMKNLCQILFKINS